MIVGIDLGTTFSLIAHVDHRSQPVLLPDVNQAESFHTPSVVHLTSGRALVGHSAELILEDDPRLTVVRFFKREMGNEIALLMDERGRGWTPPAVSALVLKKLVRDAEAFTGETVDGAVVTVPAHFNDRQRKATALAAELAELPLIELVEEPLAAAVFYSESVSRREQTILVFDLGGGTFDVTVLHSGPDGQYVIATDGASDLGGKDFDDAIIEMMLDEYEYQHGTTFADDATALVTARGAAVDMKIKLSNPGVNQVKTSLLLAGRPLMFSLPRKEFQTRIRPHLLRTIEICERCLKSSHLSWDAIDMVMLAGGSTLIPVVNDAVRIACGKTNAEVKRHLPHMAIAYGAALLSKAAAGEKPATVRQRVAGHDLGFRVYDPKAGQETIDVLIERNTPLPADKRVTYYTSRADQTSIVLDLVQQKAAGEDLVSLGRREFGPIINPRQNRPIEISLNYDISGLVTVNARDPDSGQKMEVKFGEESAHVSREVASQLDLVRGVRINQ